jgi:hypothetical protein
MKRQSSYAPGRRQATVCKHLRRLVAHGILFFGWIAGSGKHTAAIADARREGEIG